MSPGLRPPPLFRPKGRRTRQRVPQARSVARATRSRRLRVQRSVAVKAMPLTDDSKRSGGGQGHRLSRGSANPTPSPYTSAMVERPTRLLVDRDAIGHNLAAIRGRVGVPVIGIVKANAYGHGLVSVALHLQAYGIDQLGVAFLEEGISMREA